MMKKRYNNKGTVKRFGLYAAIQRKTVDRVEKYLFNKSMTKSTFILKLLKNHINPEIASIFKNEHYEVEKRNRTYFKSDDPNKKISFGCKIRKETKVRLEKYLDKNNLRKSDFLKLLFIEHKDEEIRDLFKDEI